MLLEFWIILGVICLILELFSTSFFLISISLGSFSAAIVNYLGFDLYSQLLVFMIMTIIFIVLTKSLKKKLNNESELKTNTERFIGKKAIVTKQILPSIIGQINIDNELWLAVSDEEINENETVIVESIEGVKLRVHKL